MRPADPKITLQGVGLFNKVLYNNSTLKYNYLMMIEKEIEMGFEKKVLNVVSSVTDTPAYFCNGTLFLETIDSKIATDVFFKLCDDVTAAIAFGKCGDETSYDFL